MPLNVLSWRLVIVRTTTINRIAATAAKTDPTAATDARLDFSGTLAQDDPGTTITWAGTGTARVRPSAGPEPLRVQTDFALFSVGKRSDVHVFDQVVAVRALHVHDARGPVTDRADYAAVLKDVGREGCDRFVVRQVPHRAVAAREEDASVLFGSHVARLLRVFDRRSQLRVVPEL